MKREPGPLVKEFFDLLDIEPRLVPRQIAERAGLGVNGLYNWRNGHDPTLANFEAALNAIGFHLEIVAGASNADRNSQGRTTNGSDQPLVGNVRTP